LGDASDIGRPLSVLKKYFNHSQLKWNFTEEIWWYTSKNTPNNLPTSTNTLHFEREPQEHFFSRLQSFSEWATQRKEKTILVVSHGGTIRRLLRTNYGARNVECFPFPT